MKTKHVYYQHERNATSENDADFEFFASIALETRIVAHCSITISGSPRKHNPKFRNEIDKMHGFIVFLSSQYHLVVARLPGIVFGYLVSAAGNKIFLGFNNVYHNHSRLP